MSQKVVEFYVETLKKYSKKLNKEKLTVLMQVGEFFEIYGLVYPDGKREGNIWEFCDNVNLKIAEKKQDVYENPEITVYMGGVGISYVNPYIQKAVERFGWTVVIFEQSRIGNTAKFERTESQIISPGININSESFSNITMIIYLEQTKNYMKGRNVSSTSNNISNNIINIGVSFVDCLTGANGVMAINNSNTSDISIPFDELLKLLTIKNPNELIIYMENCDSSSISDEDLINALHLFNYQYKIIREPIEANYAKIPYQSSIFNSIYVKHRGILDILQQLDIEGEAHNYSRIALCLLLDFIIKHDKSIIEKLERPEIVINNDKYLMLANNCLEQLDIIDNGSSNSCSNSNSNNNTSSRRLSLLDLLDNTKTALGKILLRQRLSMPITDSKLLIERYTTIGELVELHNTHMLTKNDKFGSPLHQLRSHLSGIKNIDNYLRKIITHKIQPTDIENYMNSLTNCIKVYEYVSRVLTNNITLKNNNNNNNNKINNTNKSYNNQSFIKNLIPNESNYAIFTKLHLTFTTDINLDALQYNVWRAIESNPFKKGVSSKLDKLQEEIDNDRGFLDNLVLELSKIIDPSYKTETAKAKIISIGENATKGIHIYTTKKNKDILEAYFTKKDAKNINSSKQSTIIIGNYTIESKNIKFTQMKESKWEIDIIYLKTSNGTLKANIDKMGRIVKEEFVKWIQDKIISNMEVLNALNMFARFIAEIDLLQSNTLNAVEKGYVAPVININYNKNLNKNIKSFIKVDKIRHPIIEHITTNAKYVPNDVVMGIGINNVGSDNNNNNSSSDGMLLFGVNAVGKSSLMKSIGINVIMAQAGMYVAASRFEYKPYKYLFTRIRNNDNLYAGLSSFEVEMKEFKIILKYANEESIILGDELCSGTNSQDATALVAAGVGILSKRKCSFIFATHLHSLSNMPEITKLSNVKLFHMLVEKDPKDPKKLIYSRKIQPGSGPNSYGILVCESMNLDDEFIMKAKEIRASMNSTGGSNEQSYTEIATLCSKYNTNKVIAMCEVCSNHIATDVHHINQQCDANHNGIINDMENGIFNKNKLWNLVSLCKECHIGVHNVPSKLEIGGYINTSDGVELQYKWLGLGGCCCDDELGSDSGSDSGSDTICNSNSNSNSDKEDDTEESNDNSNNAFENKLEVETPKPEVIIMMETKEKSNKSKKSEKVEKKGIESITEEIKEIIMKMKMANYTPKKIQFDLKRNHNIELTQHQVRNYE